MKLFITGTLTEVGKKFASAIDWGGDRCRRIIEKPQQKKEENKIICSGNENPTTEEIILKKTGVKCLGRIKAEPRFDYAVILEYATKF
ncbi:MAG: hypothetical protein H2058_07250 [Muricauda sp.]|nr:hypothetical protein [Allomuricauda sp.]MBA4745037.1 hypothetical protein [Allomuricauda sp.]